MVSASDLRVPTVPLAHSEDEEDLNSTEKRFSSSLSSDSSLQSDTSNQSRSRSPKKRALSQEANRNHLKVLSPSRGLSPAGAMMEGSFGDEAIAQSLEDLVEHFDGKISECLRNLDAETNEVAPVQKRSQDDAMEDSQVWWTLTGNFGNILPIDWSKTQARKLQLPALNLQQPNNKTSEASDGGLGLSEDDEELRQQLDMHQLIGQEHQLHTPNETSPPQTADQVIEEIDQIMKLSTDELSRSVLTDRTMESVDSMYSSMRSPQPACSLRDPDLDAKIKQTAVFASSAEKLQTLSYSQLVALNAEMEQLIQVYNESLVQELALRDELEYEKELKNTFISLLLSIQNKQRQYANERKRKGSKTDVNHLPQFMTAKIPYDENHGCPDNSTLQTLIKILRAIDEDNGNVPKMITEYILTVVCPSSSTSLNI